jgi:hypothetical protein
MNAAPDKTVRVFISSVFRDMHAEPENFGIAVFRSLFCKEQAK